METAKLLADVTQRLQIVSEDLTANCLGLAETINELMTAQSNYGTQYARVQELADEKQSLEAEIDQLTRATRQGLL